MISGATLPTMGLVTATAEEFIAMRHLLDHATERYIPDDPTRYILGALPSLDDQTRGSLRRRERKTSLPTR